MKGAPGWTPTPKPPTHGPTFHYHDPWRLWKAEGGGALTEARVFAVFDHPRKGLVRRPAEEGDQFAPFTGEGETLHFECDATWPGGKGTARWGFLSTAAADRVWRWVSWEAVPAPPLGLSAQAWADRCRLHAKGRSQGKSVMQAEAAKRWILAVDPALEPGLSTFLVCEPCAGCSGRGYTFRGVLSETCKACKGRGSTYRQIDPPSFPHGDQPPKAKPCPHNTWVRPDPDLYARVQCPECKTLGVLGSTPAKAGGMVAWEAGPRPKPEPLRYGDPKCAHEVIGGITVSGRYVYHCRCGALAEHPGSARAPLNWLCLVTV